MDCRTGVTGGLVVVLELLPPPQAERTTRNRNAIPIWNLFIICFLLVTVDVADH
jgi:hypothetical protein